MQSTRIPSAPPPALAAPRRGTARGIGHVLATAVVAWALSCGAGSAVAQEAPASGEDTLVILESEPVVLAPTPAEVRHSELKRVLLLSDEGMEMIRERKRPSAEERNALKRELREALRDVYEQRLQAAQQ